MNPRRLQSDVSFSIRFSVSFIGIVSLPPQWNPAGSAGVQALCGTRALPDVPEPGDISTGQQRPGTMVNAPKAMFNGVKMRTALLSAIAIFSLSVTHLAAQSELPAEDLLGWAARIVGVAHERGASYDRLTVTVDRESANEKANVEIVTPGKLHL